MNQAAIDFITDLQNLAQLDHDTALKVTSALLEKGWHIGTFEIQEGKIEVTLNQETT